MEQEKSALKTALNLINRRWYSTNQITEKLRIKEFNQDEIIKTIKFLEEKDFLNDVRFAKLWIKDRLNFRPKAQYYINEELKQKGVTKDDIQKAWDQINEEGPPDELAIITELARRKIKSYHSLQPQVQKQRIMSFLARRGYSYDLIKKSLALLEEDS